jgi:hypothetical protein
MCAYRQDGSNLSNPVTPAQGGTGVANNASSTLTISGNFATTLTVTGITGVTLPTSGTLATTAQLPSITATQFDVLVGGAANAIASVGPGSAGQVLQSGGNAANPVYSTATYPATATGTGTILRADGTNWTATTTTYPATNAINTLLYASSANVMAALATVNNGVLVTSATGVPSLSGTVTAWTPVLKFGGASVGITYNAQAGGYYQLGQVFFFDCYVDISNKGSSTGSASITGLPAISPARTSIFVISANSLTFTGQVNARMPNGTSTISLDMWASGGSRTELTDTAFSNSTYLQISGQVLIS